MRLSLPLIPLVVTIERRPLRPIRVRTVLVMIAVLGVTLGGEVMWRRWRDFARVAAFHANEAAKQSGWATSYDNSAQANRDTARTFRRVASNLRSDRFSLQTPKAQEYLDMADELLAQAFQGARKAKLARQLATYHAELKKKYERAAARPWEFVAPDPPIPRPDPEPKRLEKRRKPNPEEIYRM